MLSDVPTRGSNLAGRQGFGTIRDVRMHVAVLPERRADQTNEQLKK
jgi:hypothetical protein